MFSFEPERKIISNIINYAIGFLNYFSFSVCGKRSGEFKNFSLIHCLISVLHYSLIYQSFFAFNSLPRPLIFISPAEKRVSVLECSLHLITWGITP